MSLCLSVLLVVFCCTSSPIQIHLQFSRLLAPFAVSAVVATATPANANAEPQSEANASAHSGALDVALFSFAIFLILILLLVAVKIPQPTDFQFFAFRIFFSVAAGAIGVALPGFISVAVGTGIRATGGAALFLLVYTCNPGKLLKN